MLATDIVVVPTIAVAESRLPQCSPNTIPWTNCQGTFTSANGIKYIGEFKDDMANGRGTLTYADGYKYVGEFKDGKFDGSGTVYARMVQ